MDLDPSQLNNSNNDTAITTVGLPPIPPIDYLPGHVFFFDTWVDASHDEFWAYESTQAQNRTPACEKDSHQCFNHHVKKERSLVKKYEKKGSCHTLLHGVCKGGPRRVLDSILCSP